MSWLIIPAKLCMLDWGGRGLGGSGVKPEIFAVHRVPDHWESFSSCWQQAVQAVQAGIPITEISLSPASALLGNSRDGSE